MRKLKKIILNDNVEILGRSELRYIVGAATYGDTDCIWALCIKNMLVLKMSLMVIVVFKMETVCVLHFPFKLCDFTI